MYVPRQHDTTQENKLNSTPKVTVYCSTFVGNTRHLLRQNVSSKGWSVADGLPCRGTSVNRHNEASDPSRLPTAQKQYS